MSVIGYKQTRNLCGCVVRLCVVVCVCVCVCDTYLYLLRCSLVKEASTGFNELQIFKRTSSRFDYELTLCQYQILLLYIFCGGGSFVLFVARRE